MLVSVGRRPNSRDLGLEKTKVEVDEKGFIKVDPQRRTADPNILAIGDVAGEPMLAHKATREAHVAIEALAGEPAAFDNLAIPAVVFTDPEIAWCGLTETEAKNANREVKVARFPWAASGRAQTLSRTEGFTKLLFDPKTERVLGVGIVGVGAGELIAEGVLAVEMAAVARDVAETIHAAPDPLGNADGSRRNGLRPGNAHLPSETQRLIPPRRASCQLAIFFRARKAHTVAVCVPLAGALARQCPRSPLDHGLRIVLIHRMNLHGSQPGVSRSKTRRAVRCLK